jgi:hypothetical protein
MLTRRISIEVPLDYLLISRNAIPFSHHSVTYPRRLFLYFARLKDAHDDIDDYFFC